MSALGRRWASVTQASIGYPSAAVIAFIDEIALPFLQSLYGAVGYIGVMLAMAIESAMVPLPSELILPFGGFMVSSASQIEPLTGQPWNFWIVVIVATLGNTLGSLVAYAIGAYGGRPFLERYGKYLLIREHEIEAADRFFEKYGAATVFFGRLLPDRPDVHLVPGRGHADAHREVHRLLDRRRAAVVDRAGLGGRPAGRQLGRDPARCSSRSTSRSRSR